MLALIQRVTEASVEVDGATVGAIDAGLLALVGMEPGDTDAQIARMADRLLGYRVFDDGEGRMNLSLKDTGGGLLLVSQFTLAADTRSGMRASFTGAASPDTSVEASHTIPRTARRPPNESTRSIAAGRPRRSSGLGPPSPAAHTIS